MRPDFGQEWFLKIVTGCVIPEVTNLLINALISDLVDRQGRSAPISGWWAGLSCIHLGISTCGLTQQLFFGWYGIVNTQQPALRVGEFVGILSQFGWRFEDPSQGVISGLIHGTEQNDPFVGASKIRKRRRWRKWHLHNGNNGDQQSRGGVAPALVGGHCQCRTTTLLWHASSVWITFRESSPTGGTVKMSQ